MNIRGKLNSEFSKQNTSEGTTNDAILERYTHIAEGYAEVENVLAVLSDLHMNKSYVAHGKFSNIIDLDCERSSGYISSIWEDSIFKAIHSEDLEIKMLNELLFLHHIKRLSKSRRFNQCLIQKLRMRSRNGEWVDTIHRLYYIPAKDGKTARFALCLYGAVGIGY